MVWEQFGHGPLIKLSLLSVLFIVLPVICFFILSDYLESLDVRLTWWAYSQ